MLARSQFKTCHSPNQRLFVYFLRDGKSRKAPKGAFLLITSYIFKYTMSHKLLVVTFTQDLAQFQMFCHCLVKNWKGQPALIVILGKGTCEQTVKEIVDKAFDSTWSVEIKPTVLTSMGGDTEQQLNKIIYSLESATDDVIVFDSKDFLLKPCDFSIFKKQDRYRVTYKLVGQQLVDMGYDIKQIVDQPVDHLPAVSNLTPWIWNVNQLFRYWEHLENRFGSWKNWQNFPAGNEIYGYYVYTWTDPTKQIKFLTHVDMPLLIGGGWTHQTYEEMCRQAKEFEQDSNRIIWKHSRKLSDPRCVEVTRQVLLGHGIDPNFVKQVYD
jgi:hypothetical protein